MCYDDVRSSLCSSRLFRHVLDAGIVHSSVCIYIHERKIQLRSMNPQISFPGCETCTLIHQNFICAKNFIVDLTGAALALVRGGGSCHLRSAAVVHCRRHPAHRHGRPPENISPGAGRAGSDEVQPSAKSVPGWTDVSALAPYLLDRSLSTNLLRFAAQWSPRPT